MCFLNVTEIDTAANNLSTLFSEQAQPLFQSENTRPHEGIAVAGSTEYMPSSPSQGSQSTHLYGMQDVVASHPKPDEVQYQAENAAAHTGVLPKDAKQGASPDSKTAESETGGA